MTDRSQSPAPAVRDLSLVSLTSLIIALVMAGTSIAGIAAQSTLYPTDTLRRWLVINDAVNLAAGLPLLLGSVWLARRGWLIGLLCWPGALFYVLYVYSAYVIAVPFSILFLAHLALASLSAYTVIGLLARINGQVVRGRLEGHIPARTAGGILAGLALLTLLRQMAMIITTLGGHAPITMQTLSSWVADLAVMCPALLIAGIQLWQHKALGYVTGPGLLLLFGVLALGLVPGLALETPVDTAGIIVVLVMAAVCLMPFAFFARAASAHSPLDGGCESH